MAILFGESIIPLLTLCAIDLFMFINLHLFIFLVCIRMTLVKPNIGPDNFLSSLFLGVEGSQPKGLLHNGRTALCHT